MSDIVEMLRDLHRQATEERSHYYVGKCVRDSIAEIERLRSRLAEAEALLREAHERAMFSGNIGARISAHFAADSASRVEEL